MKLMSSAALLIQCPEHQCPLAPDFEAYSSAPLHRESTGEFSFLADLFYCPVANESGDRSCEGSWEIALEGIEA